MIDIDGKDLQEASLPGGRDGVGSIIRVGPCIGSIGKATVRKVVYYALVRVHFRAHEDQAVEGRLGQVQIRAFGHVLTARAYGGSRCH